MVRFKEADIQKYIWEEKEWFSELILEEIPNIDVEFDVKVEPEKLFQRITLERLKETLNYVKGMDLIGVEVPLKKEGDSTIRADFLGVNIEDVGISVIELKKDKQTERQAFTELLAYGNHLVSLFPTMVKDDIVNVLISPMEARIVREAFLHALLVDGKRIVAFIPTFEDETDIESLKLKLWMPDENDIKNFKSHYFSKENFEVVKIAWRGDSDTYDFNEDPNYAEKMFMNYISSYVAQVMEEKNIHGFCFTSRCFPELKMPYPNSLIIVGMNPYKISYKNNGYVGDVDTLRQYGFEHSVGLDDIIKGLKLEEEHIQYLENLHVNWSSHLVKVGTDSLRFLFKDTNGKRVSLEYGIFTLKQYWSSLIESGFAFNYDIFPTCGFKKLYSEVLKLDYEFVAKNGVNEYPMGDIFKELIESYKSHHFIEINLGRMFGLDLEDIM
ncbi:hypothetical protein P4647_08305 [Peribacillus frigoritolerans]|uniref:hypothetical protein n=1 Tax=Peribacillus frigoritolerans TaxID=450367 RepID=UPI002E1AA331|nr:hypothetical protein [Peribacillus frigoritolerans]